MKPPSIRCMKFLLTLFNIIAILFALFLIGVCVIDIRDGTPKSQVGEAVSHGVYIALVTVALCILLNAVLGCISALRENEDILNLHAWFFVFLVLLQLVMMVCGFVAIACIDESKYLRDQFFRNCTQDVVGNRSAVWDVLQSKNHCCGVDGPQDYAVIQQEIPSSCCALAHPLREGGARRQLHATCLAERTYYAQGCGQVLSDKYSLIETLFMIIGFLFIFMEIACTAIAMWLGMAVRDERYQLQQALEAHFET